MESYQLPTNTKPFQTTNLQIRSGSLPASIAQTI